MTATSPITNDQDIIDSRDVIERIEELESMQPESGEEGSAEWPESDDAAELESLRKLAEQASDYAADWQYGEALIRDSHFEAYARELAEDLHGNELRNASWPFDHIDWESAANALLIDYTAVDFAGVTYWIR